MPLKIPPIVRTQDAIDTPFNNSTNGFDYDDTQAAIEEIDFRNLNCEPTGFVNRTDSTISFVDNTRTFSISPVSTSFVFYSKGHKFTKSSTNSVQITDTEGTWYIYYNSSGTLTASQTLWDYNIGNVFVSYIYWDWTNKKQIIFADERHGLVMDWATHERIHTVQGLQSGRGQLVAGNYDLDGDGSLDSHAQFSLTDGVLHDEDIIFSILNSASPVNSYEQKLSTIAYLPIFYQLGSPGTWRKKDATAFAISYQVASLCQYNLYSGGSWSLATATNDYYIPMWVFATNSKNVGESIIAVMGQNQYNDPLTADEMEQYARIDLTGFPFTESLLLYRLLFRTSTTYTNTPKAILANMVGEAVPNNLARAILNRRLSSSTPFTTTSISDVPITGFSLIPEAGTWAIWYSANVSLTVNNSVASSTMFKDGVAITDSIRVCQGVGNNFVTQTSALTTTSFNGIQFLDVRVRVTSGSFTTNYRTIVLIRLGP